MSITHNMSFSLRSTNTEANSRLDIRAQGFWGKRQQDALFDIRVYNPHAPSNPLMTPSACCTEGMRRKRLRRMYDQLVQEVEHSTFAPLVFFASGSMGLTAVVFYK